jgi:hypothetical protein
MLIVDLNQNLARSVLMFSRETKLVDQVTARIDTMILRLMSFQLHQELVLLTTIRDGMKMFARTERTKMEKPVSAPIPTIQRTLYVKME